jgi:O-antigen/teichoic acid export membrane protein
MWDSARFATKAIPGGRIRRALAGGAFGPGGGGSAVGAARGLLLGQAIVVGGSLVANLLAARTMGPSGRGELAVFLQLAYLLAAIGMVGTDRAYLVARDRPPTMGEAISDVYGLVKPSVAVTALSCLLVGAVMTPSLRTAWTHGVALTVLVLGSSLVAGTRAVTVASGSAHLYWRTTIAMQALLLALISCFTVAGATSPTVWLLGYGVALCLPPLLGIVRLRKDLGRSPTRLFAPEPTRRLGRRMLAATLATMVTLRSDRFLIPWLASYHQLGIYVVAATFTELMVLPVQSLVDAHVARWRAAARAGSLRAGKILFLATAYATAAILVLASLGDLIVVAFGRAYEPSVSLILPLAVASGLWCVSRVAVGLLMAMDRPRAILFSDVPAMVLTVGGCLILVPGTGAIGAALASIVGYGAAAAVAMALCRRSAPAILIGGPS